MSRKMKDSGIDWIGNIPIDWTVVKTKYICNLFTGNSIKDEFKEQYEDSMNARPYIATKDIDAINGRVNYENGIYIKEQDENFKIAPSQSVLMCIEGGSAGRKKAFIDREVSFVNKLCCFSANDQKIVDRYMFYYLSSPGYEEEFKCNISGLIGGVSLSVLKKFPFVVPPLNTQRSISMILDEKCKEIDNIITKTQASIDEYKKLKQSIITQAVTKGVRGDREMKYSGVEWIGQIPVEWKINKITRILDYTHPYPIGDGDHGLIKTDDYLDKGIPYLRVQNLGWGTDLDLNNIVYISEENNERIKNSVLKPNDILFAKTGATIGKTAIVPSSLEISNTTSHVGKITLDRKFNAKYVFYYMSSYIGYRQLWDIACMKTTRPELSIDEMKNIKVIIPEYEEQCEIVVYLDKRCKSLQDIIEKKEKIIHEMNDLKKSLIFEYVTGKKEVV